MPEIILHNYPQSPVAEKARIALGIKGLSWFSVEIPRLAPKPMLTKLTGGYRRFARISPSTKKVRTAIVHRDRVLGRAATHQASAYWEANFSREPPLTRIAGRVPF